MATLRESYEVLGSWGAFFAYQDAAARAAGSSYGSVVGEGRQNPSGIGNGGVAVNSFAVLGDILAEGTWGDGEAGGGLVEPDYGRGVDEDMMETDMPPLVGVNDEGVEMATQW